jgi:spore coat protein H
MMAQIPQFYVTMTPTDYYLLYSRDIFSDSLLPAVVDYQSSTWTNAQIRFKGHSTRYYPKKSFRVRFNTSNLFQGMRQVNFNSMYTDKSFIREKLAWDLYADMNQTAPVASHALLSINGSPQGLFLFIDKVDRYFLQLRGRTIAPVYEADDFYTAADLTVQPDSILKLYYSKEVGNANDYSDLTQLIGAINNAPANSFADTIHTYFNVGTILNWFTGNILTMMGDSYNKNYFLYRDTSRATQQWEIIPWDYDLSFGRTGDLAVPYPASLLNDRFSYTFPPLAGPANVLKDRFISTPQLWEELRLHVDTVLQTIFTEERMYPRIDSLASLIGPEVINDPQRWGTVQDFHDHVDALKYYVTARRNYLFKTFINAPDGEYNTATLPVTQLNTPYHFVAYDGRQLATLWFSSFSGLDSITIVAHPDAMPPSLGNPSDEQYIHRWIEVIPYPPTAQFKAKFQWMYKDVSSTSTEVGANVQDERLLRTFYFDGVSRHALDALVNPIANITTINSVTEQMCGTGKHFGLAMSDTYTQTWLRVPLNNWQKWNDIQFTDSLHGFIVGEHGTILRTTDGGSTWSEHAIGFNLSFAKLFALSPETVFVIGNYGSLYTSVDAGESWSQVTLGTTRNLRDIDFYGGTTGWIVGDGVSALTTDGGTNWQSIVIDSTEIFYSGALLGPNSAIVATATDLLSTTTGGTIWQEEIALPPGKHIFTIHSNGASLWAAGDSGLVLFRGSSNTWNDISISEKITIRDLAIIDTVTLYAAGDNGTIYFTTDNGTQWYKQYTADSHDLYGMFFTDRSHGFAVGNGGTILTTTDPGTVTDVHQTESNFPAAFSLLQNYPNPFNPSTHFQFAIANVQLVTLRIYDILGREVVTLLNEMKQPGMYKVNWDASEFSSGVYFYRLQAGTFVETKKLMLLK